MGRIYYLMGKSATGKDHIYEQLMKDPRLGLRKIVLYTTRPMRSGERDGVQYHFTDERFLEACRKNGTLIESRVYHTIYGPWYYFTVDDGETNPSLGNLLAIGTLESYKKMRDHYGEADVIPVYIEVDDGLRLQRALQRERKQTEPKYEEMCRRFLADQEDFSEEKLQDAHITKRYENNAAIEDCIEEIAQMILKTQTGQEE